MFLTEEIPKKRFNEWVRLFRGLNGRFVSNPIDLGDSILVEYTFDDNLDCAEFSREWRRRNTPIVEKRRSKIRRNIARIFKI